jgi:hypothetical protein
MEKQEGTMQPRAVRLGAEKSVRVCGRQIGARAKCRWNVTGVHAIFTSTFHEHGVCACVQDRARTARKLVGGIECMRCVRALVQDGVGCGV